MPSRVVNVCSRRALCFAVLVCITGLAAALPERSLRVVREKEEMVRRLAEEAASVFRRRGKLTKQCTCSVHECRTEFSQKACTLFQSSSQALCDHYQCRKKEGGAVSFVQTPPDVDADAVGPEVLGGICLYKALEPLFLQLDPEPRTTTRISLRDGHSRVYPGAAMRNALLEKPDRFGKACEAQDPRRRADYVGASVGPKDIVFVIDSTREMARPWIRKSNSSWLDTVAAASQSLLDTLSAIDRVNLVAFSDKARRRGTGESLYPATKNNLRLLKSTMGALYPLGDGNVRDGIDLAFQLLIESSKERKKRQEFYRGRKVVVVIAGKSDKAQKASEFLRKLDRYQRQLEGVAGVRASVFCYSIDRQTDDALLKQIACAHNGAWFSVGPKEDVLHLFNSYNTFLALSHTGSNPVWTGFRKDPYAPGRVATVSKSFHSRAGNGVNAMLLGVVSHDVHLDEIKTSGTSWEEVEEALVERSRKHDFLDTNECQLQVHRNVFANGTICVDAFPTEYADHKRTKCKKRKKSEKRRRHPCIEYEGMYYQTVLEGLPWEDAALKCVQRGGALAQATSLDALAFLASMASPDGTWIAARGNSKGTKLRWLRSNATQIVLTEHVVHQSANVSGLCVRLDNRGATSNMETTPCGTLLSYTCVYASRKRCPHVMEFPKRGYFWTPPLDLCIQTEEALANVALVPSTSSFTPSQLWCSLDHGRDDLQSLCCANCTETIDTCGKRKGRRQC